MQVDGTLNIEGDVFIPAGATFGDLEDQLATKADTTYVNGKYSGFKNYIINGNFDVWQRGTSQTTSGYGSDDRWNNINQGSSKTHSRVLCTDAERALFNADYFSRTVANSVAGTGNGIYKSQSIENITKLAGKTVTLSFWARADSNKNIAISHAQAFGTGGTPSPTTTYHVSRIALTTSWQKFTLTFSIPSIVGKTLGTDGVHTSIQYITFWFDAGSNINAYTDNLGQQSGIFDIAQVQLEEGSVATPFEQRPYGLELSLCERYFKSSREYIGSGTYNGLVTASSIFGTTMRVTPTLSSSNATPGFGTIHAFYHSSISLTFVGVGNSQGQLILFTALDAEL